MRKLTELTLWIDLQMLNLTVVVLSLCGIYNRRYARAKSLIVYDRNTLRVPTEGKDF